MSLDDAAARARALDPTASFIVEAAAGSGKTSLLTQRLLVLLARVDEPEYVLAVTFTRKAVEEMRGRVLEALALAAGPLPEAPHERHTHALASAVLARDAARGWQLREQPTRLRIQTLDALAGGLARRLPLTAGLAAQLEVVDDASDLYQQAARDTLACLEEEEYAAIVEQVLEHFENDTRRLAKQIEDMLARRDLWLPRVSMGARRGEAEAALGAVVAAKLDELTAALRTGFGGGDDLRAYARCAAEGVLAHGLDNAIVVLDGWDGQTFDPAICAGLAELLLTKEATPRKKPNRRQGVTPQNKTQFETLRDRVNDVLLARPALCAQLDAARELPPSRYTDAQWQTIEAVYALLRLAAGQLMLVFAETGRCDFTAVTEAAREALGSADAPSDLALALDHRLEHLLVDEFQDTSATQHALLGELTAGWTGDDGRTLFFVGDPLQSIYRFRQAEVALFIDTVARGRWGEVPLTPLRLTANFRTTAPLIEWINDALARAFETAPALLPPYVPLSATRGPTAHPVVGVHAVDADEDNALSALHEALAVLAVIEDARARRPQASVAVLVRSRAHLGALPVLLAAARVPVAATDIEPLADAPVVNDLMLLTRALCQPADRVAWLGLLRAPWCGLDLASLSSLIEGRPEVLVCEALLEERWRASLSDAARRRVEALCNVMMPALARVRRMAWSELVERTWLALRGPALVDDAGTLRHAQRFLELLARFESANATLSAPVLADYMGRHFAPVPRDAGTAVQIMTLHRAKGLEFDVVIVPGIARRVMSDPQRLALWVDHEAARQHGPLLAPLPPVGSDGEPIYAFLRALDTEEQRAEAFRLLYVGLTRAKDELHFCARRAFDSNGELKRSAQGFLGMLAATLVPAVEAAPDAVRATLDLPPPPTRRRLREDCLPAAPVPVSTRAATPLPAPEFASPTAKHVGTVTHLLLELIGTQGLAAWSGDSLAARAPFIRHELVTLGVPAAALAAATRRVTQAVATALTSARGRWIFDDSHGDRASERHYTAVLDGVLIDAVIDRCFVDADGVRWIVDFKTSEPGTSAADDFIAREVGRYREQLERYARLVRLTETRPIALGLYFPSFDGWHGWTWDG